MTTRQEQRDETRGRILAAALDEFIERGYHGASTRSITAASNVSSGLLFHYFANKDELYTELVRIAFRHFAFDRDAALANPLAYFQQSAADVIAMLRDQPGSARMFVFMGDVTARRGLVPAVDDLIEANDIVTVSLPIVVAGQDAGVIRRGPPEALAVAFWGALQGIADERAANPDRPLPDPEWIIDIIRERTPQ